MNGPPAEQLFREHAPCIYNLALRMLGNDADAEDVTSEVLVQVVRTLDTLRGEAALTTWLHRITVNAALALRRKRAACREHETARPGEDPTPRRSASPDPVQQAMGCELAGLIRAATERLPTQYREVFVLADVEGISDPEVAQRLGLTLSAVKSRLHRARLMLRQALAPHFGKTSA